MWKERRDVGLKSVEICTGAHGYRYALIKVAKKKRAIQLQKIFEAYDKEATSAMQIKLTNLPDEPSIVSFGQGHEFMEHAIYREIEKAKDASCPSYFSWSYSDGHHPDSSSLSKAATKLRRLLETDMVPSSLNPSCSKPQRAEHTKNESTVLIEGANTKLIRVIKYLHSFSNRVRDCACMRWWCIKQPDTFKWSSV
jgi:hypothetical protein